MRSVLPCPYVGPRPFEIGETCYGRSWETLELRDLLIARRIVLLHSPSGAGKTSLIQAGLIPELTKERFRVLPVVRVGNEPKRDALERGDGINRYVLSVVSALDEALPEMQRTELVGSSLAGYLERFRRIVSAAGEEPTPEVLILDQFEEILTLDPTDVPLKEAFFNQLGEVLRDHRRWALFAMREDYVATLEPYLRVLPNRLSARFRLDFLTPEPARLAMQEPPRRMHVVFTDAAAAKLIDDLRRVRIQQPDGTMLEQPGPYIEPVQLQVVCKRLWESDRVAAAEITETDVAAFGSVDNALGEYYAHEVAAVANEFGIRERVVREWFEAHLITEQGLRGQVPQGVGQTKGVDNRAISRLIAVHLVREEKRRGVTWFELTHDRLIEPIRRNNAVWREGHLIRFQRLAAVWDQRGRPTAILLRGNELRKADRWAKANRADVTDAERSFLTAAHQQHRASQEEQQRLAAVRANLADLGWGVIFGDDADPAIREALAELLDHRRRQATGKRDDYYREFIGEYSYRTGEGASQFLARNKAGSGPANPENVPYYLLVVGDPQEIPFQFQYDLAPQYAVGRMYFDTVDEYAAYARSVVTAENQAPTHIRRAVIFGPRHDFDQATNLAGDVLLNPLAESLGQLSPSWTVDRLLGPDAMKDQLRRALSSAPPPALLFTASHGMEFRPTDSYQLRHQGALVCQDWPGFGKVSPDYYFSADDVPTDARLLRLIAFLYCGYSAGTPQLDDFTSSTGTDLTPIAPRAFVAALPQRLLGLPQGGALAVIGHVARTWSTSFLGDVSEFGVFESTVRRLLSGHTVGSAMEILNNRYALLSSRLAQELRQCMFLNKEQDAVALRKMDTAAIDARNYIVIGDPAVRLQYDEP